ncbi:MAG TPA: zinc ribbon domain-containing protein [Chthonomonadaceae bacterium]|nr:zinc ribbon domain-containing protein [Chthonomonadaceae bacterium]
MTAPQKICPQCQTVAPLEAAFCRQCGRQYRTQFAPGGVPMASGQPIAPVPPPPAPIAANPPQALSRRMVLAVAAMGALVVFLSVLAIRSSMQQHGSPSADPHTSVGRAQPPPFAPPQVSTAVSSDPVNEEAKRFIERESAEHGLDPPSGAVSSDGRIHLRGGGSITKEEWDKAKRSVQGSQMDPPIPAPPMP